MPIRILFLLTGLLGAEPITTQRLSCVVENTPASTLLTMQVKASETPVKFRITWLSGAETPAEFKNQPVKNNTLTSTYLLANTTLTRTILASQEEDCLFIHVQSDQPGPVHFTAHFVSENPAKIHDRRQLTLSGKETHAHAWIIPYESDVSDDGKSTITLSGEGEALIILNLTSDPAKHPIADTLTRLGGKHDPGHTPPSPHLIWEGVREERVREGGGEGEKE